MQLPCFTAVRAEIALMSGSAFAVTHQKIIDMAMNGVGCRATARIMGVGLNTILRHLKNSGRSR
ncbi:hypothetical protein AWG35_11320 [Escherichia coli]|nr:hypothetical protein AWG35_11320 [Escherichia coli]